MAVVAWAHVATPASLCTLLPVGPERTPLPGSRRESIPKPLSLLFFLWSRKKGVDDIPPTTVTVCDSFHFVQRPLPL